MNLYQSKTTTLSLLKEKPFKLEREIQNLFEVNLNQIMGLELVKSEFTIKNKRIDTLAYDNQSQAFIIIEYKKVKANQLKSMLSSKIKDNKILKDKLDKLFENNNENEVFDKVVDLIEKGLNNEDKSK